MPLDFAESALWSSQQCRLPFSNDCFSNRLSQSTVLKKLLNRLCKLGVSCRDPVSCHSLLVDTRRLESNVFFCCRSSLNMIPICMSWAEHWVHRDTLSGRMRKYQHQGGSVGSSCFLSRQDLCQQRERASCTSLQTVDHKTKAISTRAGESPRFAQGHRRRVRVFSQAHFDQSHPEIKSEC